MSEAKAPARETYLLPCQYCGKKLRLSSNSPEVVHGLAIFCHDNGCEDRFSWFGEPYKSTHKTMVSR